MLCAATDLSRLIQVPLYDVYRNTRMLRLYQYHQLGQRIGLRNLRLLFVGVPAPLAEHDLNFEPLQAVQLPLPHLRCVHPEDRTDLHTVGCLDHVTSLIAFDACDRVAVWFSQGFDPLAQMAVVPGLEDVVEVRKEVGLGVDLMVDL